MNEYSTCPMVETTHKAFSSALSVKSALDKIKWRHEYKQAHNNYLSEVSRMPLNKKWLTISTLFFLKYEVIKPLTDTLFNGKIDMVVTANDNYTDTVTTEKDIELWLEQLRRN